MLKINIIGNLGKDAEIKDFNGNKFISFNVAHTEKYKKQDGTEVNNTTWISCLKKVADSSALAKYLTKGTKVYLEGTPSVKLYQTKDGATDYSFNCSVLHLALLSANTTADGEKTQPQASNATNEPISQPTNDFPF